MLPNVVIAFHLPLWLACVSVILSTTEQTPPIRVNSSPVVDVLCFPEMNGEAATELRRIAAKVRRHCGQWPQYFRLLDEDIIRGVRVTVVLPSTLFSEAPFAAAMQSRLNNFPLVRWVAQSLTRQDENASTYYICRSPNNASRHSSPCSEQTALKCRKTNTRNVAQILSDLTDKPLDTQLSRENFTTFPCKVVTFTDMWEGNFTCVTKFRDALDMLNASCEYTSFAYDGWLKSVIELSADALDAHMIYDFERSRHIHYTKITSIETLSYYVQKRMSWKVNFVSYDAVSSLLIAVCAAASTLTFYICFLNYAEGRSPWLGLGGVLFAAWAAVLNLSPAYPPYLSSRLSGRLLLAFWALGVFLLSAYVQGLLTTSVGVGQFLDSDDTVDKLIPKLRSGKLRVCADLGSYVAKALSTGAAHSQFIQDIYAALVTNPMPSQTRTDFNKWCPSLVAGGTHVLATEDDLECDPDFPGIVRGKPRFDMQLATVLVTRESPYRDLMTSIVAKTSETGWPHFYCSPYRVGHHCENPKENRQAEIKLEWKLLCGIYLGSCAASLIVLVLETLAKRYYEQRRASLHLEHDA